MQMHKKRILLVEEDYVYFLFFKEVLGSSYHVTRAVSFEETKELIQSDNKFDLIIYNAITGCEKKSVEFQQFGQVLVKQNLLIIVDIHCYDTIQRLLGGQLFFAHSIADIVSINETIDDLISVPTISPAF